MLYKRLLIPGLIYLASCQENRNEHLNQAIVDSVSVDTISILKDTKNNLNIQTKSFSEIDSSGIIVFPLSMGETESGDGESRLFYKEMPYDTYWNIIFLNGKTNEYHLLSDRKMLIKNYDYKYRNDEPITNKYIFYTIVTDDYNKDKKLTSEDPAYLFVTDNEGNNLRQISPKNCDLNNWQFVKSLNKVIMTVKKDSDRDHKFEDKDEVTTYEVDIDNRAEAKEIFPAQFKDQLKILFDRDWQRLKKK